MKCNSCKNNNTDKCKNCTVLAYEGQAIGVPTKYEGYVINDVLEYLEDSYTGAKMVDDYESMLRIARAIEAYNLDTEKDCRIESI